MIFAKVLKHSIQVQNNIVGRQIMSAWIITPVTKYRCINYSTWLEQYRYSG